MSKLSTRLHQIPVEQPLTCIETKISRPFKSDGTKESFGYLGQVFSIDQSGRSGLTMESVGFHREFLGGALTGVVVAFPSVAVNSALQRPIANARFDGIGLRSCGTPTTPHTSTRVGEPDTPDAARPRGESRGN